MKTSELLNALRARPNLPLAFSTAAGRVSAGFHLTEVKRVTHETVDCGAVGHHWTENQFELWTPSNPEPGRLPMLASKFLRIVDKVCESLDLDGEIEARVFGRVEDGPDQLHRITSIEAAAGSPSIEVRLEPVTASCKARDRREAETPAGSSCCGSSDSAAAAGAGCCGSSKATVPSDSDVYGYRKTGNEWFTQFESHGIRFSF